MPSAPVPPAVPRALVGYVDSPATPSLDPARLGRVEAAADGPLIAWGFTTLRLRYIVGHHGLDDRGAPCWLRRLRLRPSLPVEGLPEVVGAWPGRALRLEMLVDDRPTASPSAGSSPAATSRRLATSGPATPPSVAIATAGTAARAGRSAAPRTRC